MVLGFIFKISAPPTLSFKEDYTSDQINIMMKKLKLLVLIVIYCSALQSQSIVYAETEKDWHWNKKKFEEALHSSNYDILYHKIRWEVDPGKRYIQGTVTSLFKAKVDNFSSITFDLSDHLGVDSVGYKGQKLPFMHKDDILEINLNTTLSENQTDSLTIFYRGVPVNTGFGTFELSTHGQSGVPVLWTLSEPFGAKEWWPCKQSLSDKIDSIDIIVETPMEYRVGSNGKLIYEKVGGEKRVTYWKHRYPIAAYLVGIAVTNYASYSHYARMSETDSVEILNFVYPEDRYEAEAATEYTVDVLEFFSKTFMPYPFSNEKYGHAQFGWGGGMEHQTMSFMGSFREGLITHELAHQWFGNYVTCSSWQDIWVNEGFAVFCEGLVIENLHPEDWLDWKKSELDNVLLNCSTGSVFVRDTTSVERIFHYGLTYKKGGFILHMLRHQLSDEVFFAGVRNLLASANGPDSFVSATDVKKHFEAAGDTNLTDFFDQWYYGEGYPEYKIILEHNTKDSVVFTISQTTTHSSVEFYSLKIPLQFEGDGKTRAQTFLNTVNNQRYVYKPGFKVEEVVLDPGYTILAPHRGYLEEKMVNQERFKEDSLKVSPNPVMDSFEVHSPIEFEVRNIEFYDLSGKFVLRKEINRTLRKHSVNISKLPAGQYVARINLNDSQVVKQIVKKSN